MDEIRTRRLCWREPRPSDVDGYMSFVSDYEVVKWTSSWPHPADREFVASRCVSVDPAKGFAGPVFLGDEQIGGIGMMNGELGYFIARKHWGQGYATEMARAVIARAFQRYDHDQIKASVIVGNPGSGRVLEKLGFTETGPMRCTSVAQGGEFDSVGYRLTRADWLVANAYEIHTERLLIRELRDDDWRDLQRIGGVPDVARMLFSVKAPWGDADVQAWLKMSKWQGRAGFRPAVTLLDGTLIGTLGFGGDPATCAYFFGRDHWGKGYATEAMTAFLADIFQRFPVDEIRASHFNDNPASGRVLSKLGFTQTGQAMGSSAARLEHTPETLYRLIRTKFEASR